MRHERLLRVRDSHLLDQRISFGAGGTIGEGDIVAGRRECAHDRGAEAASAAGHEYAPFCCCVSHHRGSRLITSETFCPPKPNEFDSTCVTRPSRALFGTTSSRMVGSGTS